MLNCNLYICNFGLRQLTGNSAKSLLSSPDSFSSSSCSAPYVKRFMHENAPTSAPCLSTQTISHLSLFWKVRDGLAPLPPTVKGLCMKTLHESGMGACEQLTHPNVLPSNKHLGYSDTSLLQSLLQLIVVELVHINVLLLYSHPQVVEYRHHILAFLTGAPHPMETGCVNHHLPIFLQFLQS